MPKSSRYKPISAIFLALLVCVGFCLYVEWQAHQTEKRVEAFLSELQNMRVGEATSDSVQQFAASHHRFLAKGADPFCHDQFCTYAFTYGTAVLGKLSIWGPHLWRLHLTPAPAYFSAALIVRGNRLVRTIMTLSSDIIPRTVLASVTDEVSDISPTTAPYSYAVRPSNVVVYVKPSAGAAQKEAAYAFNLNCMDKTGGCHEATELLPRAVPPQ